MEKLLIRELENAVDNLKAGNCYLSEEEQSEILDTITHTAIGAEEVCKELNISRATMTNYIKTGKIPKGRKLRYRKDKIWFRDEIRKLIQR